MKPIASGRFLNYHSLHPLHQKMNIALNFAKRVFMFSTNCTENAIKTIIRRHPKSLISRVINRAKQRLISSTAMEASENTPEEDEKLFRSLTNIDGLSSRISKTLKKEYANIQVATKTTKTVGTLLPSIKDKTAKEQQSNVIYKIQCGDCEACYIGMTTTKLKQRISGHRSNVRRLETLRAAGYTNEDATIMEVREKTALVDHAAAMDHTFRLENVNIIDKSNRSASLPILESCHIRNTTHTVNKRTDTDNLNVAYAAVLHTIKNIRKTERRDQNRTNVNSTTSTNTTTHQTSSNRTDRTV